MGTNNSNQGHPHDGQKNYQNSNQRNPDNVRNDTAKHQYAKHDEETNDENFKAGKPKLDNEMDFRDKNDNLDGSDNQ